MKTWTLALFLWATISSFFPILYKGNGSSHVRPVSAYSVSALRLRGEDSVGHVLIRRTFGKVAYLQKKKRLNFLKDPFCTMSYTSLLALVQPSILRAWWCTSSDYLTLNWSIHSIKGSWGTSKRKPDAWTWKYITKNCDIKYKEKPKPKDT